MCLQAFFSSRKAFPFFFFLINTRFYFIRCITRNYLFDMILLIIHLGDTSMKNAFVKIRIV